MSLTFGTTKDPDDIDDFAWNWAARLATGETISDHDLPAVAGITIVTSSISGSSVVARLSGGTAGESYSLTCEITTSTGRVLQQTGKINVAER